MGKITINDIAKKAGVAKSTVSRVLNGTNNVKPETRETIQAIIEETGYQPSEVARGLSTSKSNVIGVIIPNASLSSTNKSVIPLFSCRSIRQVAKL